MATLRSLTKSTARSGAGLSASLRGALWMCAAATAFALMITLVRHLTDGLHPLQVVFFRTAFGLLAMLPWLLRQGLGVLRTGRFRLHLLRALIGIFAMVGWFTTLSLMPLAEATALSFTAPIFTSVLAGLILGEAMRLRRWSATALGFLGALIIVRPGFAAIDPAALLAVITAAIWASSTILIKIMARTESAGAITTYMVLPPAHQAGDALPRCSCGRTRASSSSAGPRSWALPAAPGTCACRARSPPRMPRSWRRSTICACPSWR
jgi:drug/metabolite transporter (DMT)-like permease